MTFARRSAREKGSQEQCSALSLAGVSRPGGPLHLLVAKQARVVPHLEGAGLTPLGAEMRFLTVVKPMQQERFSEPRRRPWPGVAWRSYFGTTTPAVATSRSQRVP
jgi:hypothetical protein